MKKINELSIDDMKLKEGANPEDAKVELKDLKKTFLEFCNCGVFDKAYKALVKLSGKELVTELMDISLKKGEEIEDLIEKSEDLNGFTKQFYENSKQLNRVDCRIMKVVGFILGIGLSVMGVLAASKTLLLFGVVVVTFMTIELIKISKQTKKIPTN